MLMAHPSHARERLWNYRERLYDFKDAIWFHLETDERIFESILGEHNEDPIEEHREIQKLVSEMISLADNIMVEKLGQVEVEQYGARLGAAFVRICRLIELHIAKENAILERVQGALERHQFAGGASG